MNNSTHALQLEQYEGAITANQPAPTNTSTDLNSIINALSPGSELLAEVKSLTPLLAALMECPSHIIRNAVSLTSTKRQTLVDLVSEGNEGQTYANRHFMHNFFPIDSEYPVWSGQVCVHERRAL